MKVAVSIPDLLFADADDLARRMKVSRSRIYARALDEFVAKHGSEQITDAMNAALKEVGDDAAAFTREGARRVFARTEW